MNTFEGLKNNWKNPFTIKDQKMIIVVEPSFNAKTAIGQCHITGFLKKGRLYQKFEENHIERGYNAYEIEQPLKKAGYVFKKYDGNKLSRSTKKSVRLLYCCKKHLTIVKRSKSHIIE